MFPAIPSVAGSCKCGRCHPGGKNMSLQEEKELEIIESNIEFNTSTGRFCASLPWTENRKYLEYNESMAYAVMRSTERQLQKKGNHLRELYSSQITDMLDRKAAREVTREELSNYSGQKYFLTHLAVPKPDSKSTPYRLVFNSSAQYKGHSVNGSLLKGPTVFNPIWGVLLRFRQHPYAYAGDLSKMYHSIDIPNDDQMMHLFLWRFHENVHPSIFAITALNMGDKPSSAIAQICLRKSAEASSLEHPEAAKVITDNSYMDDILGSSRTLAESQSITNTIESILEQKGFRIKEWSLNDNNGTHTQVDVNVRMPENALEAENALGMKWIVENDKLKFKITFAVENLIDNPVTRRNIVKILNRIFDPMGLLASFIVKCKIVLRDVYATCSGLGWDDPVPKHLETEWKKILLEIPEIANLSFHRSITPENATGNPQLIIFSDGSKSAFGAVAYARWKISGGGFKCRLIAAKDRAAPVKIEDIVKLELCGALLSVRLRETIIQELSDLEFTKVTHIVDSEIVHAMIHKESYGFNTFAGNRVGEIQRKSSPDEWAWISGKLNISDMLTRGCSPSQLGEGSEWQEGPNVLQLEESLWPIKFNVNKDIVIPHLKKPVHSVAAIHHVDSLATRIDTQRFSKWYRLINTTAYVLKLYQRFKQGGENNTTLHQADIYKAEVFWIKESQKDFNTESKQLQKFRPRRNEDGIIVVGGRTERWMEGTWNRQFFILLPKKHHVSLLIARREHARTGHLGRDATISKIRATYWILGVRGIVKNLIDKCVLCKAKLQKLLQQVMAPLPIERLKPCPPFTNVMIDYFGPYIIRGEVQKRTRGKCFGVLFTCMNMRAVYVDIANDYSTLGFLMVLRRFASIRGWPTKFFSDKGSQLTGASNELKTVIDELDWNLIEERSRTLGQGTEWNFSPANAPWYNGAVEALVKTTKKALNISVGENILSFSELQTCMFEAAELVNQRPIGNHQSEPSDAVYLCPNDLLLGRASSSIPEGPFQDRSSHKYRFDFVQKIVSAFWKRWVREVFPNLVIYPKWHTERRNLKVGDIVLMQDDNILRGKWKKALVIDATPSADGKVRHVILQYRTPSNIQIKVDRPVQRLILLVPVDNDTE